MATATADAIGLKIKKVFSALDANNDGYVDWSDFQSIIDRYRSEYRLDNNNRKAMALHAAYAMLWQELARHADLNGDQRLSEEEYVAATRSTVLDISRFDSVNGLTDATFDVMDADGDNQISKDEYLRLANNIWGISSPEAAQAFAALDTDGDGHISRPEFIRAAREFFLSPDPAAPGSLTFGRV
ncbi:EF-hand domain-containing protein [Streptomyces sp. NPDC017936]|uniref:EF-hand domain-containing protein n=1 Tax=Streptomyces sp. NPDC017936 TaxID=3365016 RepID=UPI0037BD9C5E